MRDPITHELKCWPDEYQATLDGRKLFEIRKQDRDFQVGDLVKLREWISSLDAFSSALSEDKKETYTGRASLYQIKYLVSDGDWGLPAGLCVFSLSYVAELKE